MTATTQPNDWFVGAALGGSIDKTDELVEQGIWRFFPGPAGKNRYEAKIRAMKPGDRIAIKAAFVRKHDLPFDNRGKPVSVMAIKAVGEITENLGDGLQVRVNWQQRFDPPKEWYFYTARASVWRLKKDDWAAQGLSRFAFEDDDQDIDRFLHHPYWARKYSPTGEADSRFGWTVFFQSLADHLRKFRSARDRRELVGKLEDLASKRPHLDYIFDPAPGGGRQFVADIDPFTVIGTFNRNLGIENRRALAADIAEVVGLEMEVPESFDGVPMLSQMRSKFFFRPDDGGKPEHIQALWDIFTAALDWSESEDDSVQTQRLAELYTQVLDQPGVAWMLSMGLFWIRPEEFVSLDRNSRNYLQRVFGIRLPNHNSTQRLNGDAYLELVAHLRERFEDDDAQVNSFPELSYQAWVERKTTDAPGGEPIPPEEGEAGDVDLQPYGLDNLVTDGCFLAREQLETMLKRLERRKNIILQGPPGTGKTWLSKRLAFSLIGYRADEQITAVQFHPTLSYEDFVRGWRPSAEGRLQLAEGPLMQTVAAARKHSDRRYVVVIEEINRGNPAQIFGEMLTLIESDKRAAEYALRLSHMHEGESPIHLPTNLYLIGTMNVADRSLALVDLALRRRFAFIDLEPELNSRWADWLETKGKVDRVLVEEIAARMRKLNETIAADEALGPQFRVGHSYVTPAAGDTLADARGWFRAVVETEIGPLLEEYWFDRPDLAIEQKNRLLSGW